MAKRSTAVARARAPEAVIRLLDSELSASADNRVVEAVCSTATEDRMGDSVVQAGIEYAGYMKTNPVGLWAHNHDMPICRCVEMGLVGGNLRAKFAFPPEGEDADADWVHGKIRAGLVNAVSIGFLPKEYEPIDPKQPWGGLRFKKSELIEVSFCSVPANAQAVIIGRSVLAAAALELPPSRRAKAVPLTAKGLYEVSWLASLLADLGYLEDWVAYEAEQEGDGSAVPAMLADALRRLGAALVAMTQEEVAELLGEEVTETDGGSVIMAAMRRHQAEVLKAGRVLSAANEADIRQAVDLLTNVLAQVDAGEEVKAARSLVERALSAAGLVAIKRDRLTSLENIAEANRRRVQREARRRRLAVIRFGGV